MQRVVENTAFWQNKLDKKEITLVNFKPRAGQTAAKCWTVFRRIVDIEQSKELPAIYSTVKSYAVCPPCKKVIKYGSATSVLVKHIHSKACRVGPDIKNKFTGARKRNSGVVLSPSQDGKKKLKQSLLVASKPKSYTLPEFEPEEKQMFRKKMLIWDLGVINKDLRPFNVLEGSGMQARDQALWNLAVETGRKVNIMGSQNSRKILSEENRGFFQTKLKELQPTIRSAAQAKELHLEVDLWDAHKRSYMGVVGHLWKEP